jgi:phosphoglycolate phosphatase-like HAD superfamily hydrolase
VIRCIVFDFDGTLVDSNAIKRRAFFDVLRGLDPDGAAVGAALEAHPGADRYALTREIARALAGRGALPGGRSIEDWAREWAEAYTQQCEREVSRCDEIPGARSALERLRERGVALFVSSSTPAGPLARLLELRSLAGCFRGVYGAPETKLEALRRIQRDEGVTADEMLVVGDGEDDRSAAAALGCHFVAVVREGPDRFGRPPRRRVRALDELPRIVDELDARGPAPGACREAAT